MSETPKPAYSPGLDGIIAGESAICCVDATHGLRYYGYGIETLAPKVPFEDVAWLLLHGEFPNDSERKTFASELAASAALPPGIIEILKSLPKTTRAMDALRTGVSALAAYDPEVGKYDHAANLRKSVRLISRMTSVTTAAWRIEKGKPPIPPSGGSLATRFLFGLDGKNPQDWQVRALDTVFNLYAEHEFNASTFAARVTASTLADIYSAIVTAIGALEGPLHGGANEQAMTMLREIGSPKAAEPWVKDRLARKEKIMGFGHRVYKKGDSRVPVMRAILAEIGKRVGQTQWIDICLELDRVMEKEKGLYANLDLYAAPVLMLLEIPSELNTPLFACARVAGWCAHVIEQQDHNRIIRPRCIYTGPAPRDVS
jgi:2-methylcitrate synthase/citrate synthase II